MISICILRVGGAGAGGGPDRSGRESGEILVVATLARDFVHLDTRIPTDSLGGGETGVDIPPVGYDDEASHSGTVAASPARTDEPDVLLRDAVYTRFRAGWSSDGLLCFERVRLSGGPMRLDYVGGSTTVLPDDEDQVFGIAPGPVRLACGPFVVLLRPGPVDALWPAPPASPSPYALVRRARLATLDDIDWWLRTRKGAAAALLPVGAGGRSEARKSSTRILRADAWTAEAHWPATMVAGRNHDLRITLRRPPPPPSASASPRALTLVPHVRGATAWPRRQLIEFAPGETEATATFGLTPQGSGEIPDARVEVWFDRRPLGRIDTPLRVRPDRAVGLPLAAGVLLMALWPAALGGAALWPSLADLVPLALLALAPGALLVVAAASTWLRRRPRMQQREGPLRDAT